MNVEEVEVFGSGLPARRMRAREDEGVVEIALRGHDPVHAGLLQASVHVLDALYVAVRENRYFYGAPASLNMLFE